MHEVRTAAAPASAHIAADAQAKVPDEGGCYRGGGNTTRPKLLGPGDTPRPTDFDIRRPPNSSQDMVFPNPRMGLSFCTTIDAIAARGLRGWVWSLAGGSPLPEGLVFHLDPADPEHLLLNVTKPVAVATLVDRLKSLENRMQRTNRKLG